MAEVKKQPNKGAVRKPFKKTARPRRPFRAKEKPAEAGQEVIRALDQIVRKAVKSRASDIHIEP